MNVPLNNMPYWAPFLHILPHPNLVLVRQILFCAVSLPHSSDYRYSKMTTLIACSLLGKLRFYLGNLSLLLLFPTAGYKYCLQIFVPCKSFPFSEIHGHMSLNTGSTLTTWTKQRLQDRIWFFQILLQHTYQFLSWLFCHTLGYWDPLLHIFLSSFLYQTLETYLMSPCRI